MAKYFAQDFKDITVAFPVNILEIETINELVTMQQQEKEAVPFQLNLLVENVEAVHFLRHNIKAPVGIYIKVDVGYGRTGIPAQNFNRIDAVLEQLLSKDSRLRLGFRGFLTHAGHSYHCRTKQEILQVHRLSKELLFNLKEHMQDKHNTTAFEISVGDTPTCSVVEADELVGFHEIRPGNFVFYDVEQATIGSCSFDNVAVAMVCPVVALHPSRREIVLYGGGVHFSKDRLVDADEKTIFGRVVQSLPGSPLRWDSVIDGMYLRSCSQEHGIVVVPPDVEFDSYRVGDLVKVLPVHSCMTADAMKNKGYLTCDGKWISRMVE
jgi:D-serine deaminase-like pyridoxal phosphate-dependent protein